MAEAARASTATANGRRKAAPREPQMLSPLPRRPDDRQDQARAAAHPCPTCQSHASVDKVSHVVRSGRGRLFWENGEVAHYETELSGLLDAPPKPRETPIYRAVVGLLPPLVLLVAILVTLEGLRSQDFVSIRGEQLDLARNIALAWFGLVMPGLLILRYAKSRVDLRKKLPLWKVAHRRWTGLYYCSHDDLVFLPQANLVATPWEMNKILYVAGGPEPRTRISSGLVRNVSVLGVLLVLLGGSMGALSSSQPDAGATSPSPAVRQTPSSTSGEPAIEAAPANEALLNRGDCAAIRGTDYLSPEERAWYLANCVQ